MIINKAYAATEEDHSTVAAETASEQHTTQATTEHTETPSTGGIAALGIDGKLLVAQIINFILLFLILRKFVYRPLLNLLEKRRADIEKSVDQAKSMDEHYAAFQIEHEKRIEEAQAQAALIIEQARIAGETLRKETQATANKETEKLLAKAHEEIAHEKEKMFTELKSDVGMLVIETAEKILGKEVDEKTQAKLVAEATEEVK